jgi:hypothetical protein
LEHGSVHPRGGEEEGFFARIAAFEEGALGGGGGWGSGMRTLEEGIGLGPANGLDAEFWAADALVEGLKVQGLPAWAGEQSKVEDAPIISSEVGGALSVVLMEIVQADCGEGGAGFFPVSGGEIEEEVGVAGEETEEGGGVEIAGECGWVAAAQEFIADGGQAGLFALVLEIEENHGVIGRIAGERGATRAVGWVR